jgi:hypothetical protein
MFVKVELDLINRMWRFLTSTYTISLYQLNDTTDNVYEQQVNDDVSKFDLKQQVFPDNTVFDFTTGTYIKV